MSVIGWKKCATSGGGVVYVNLALAKSMTRMYTEEGGFTRIYFSDLAGVMIDGVDVSEPPEVLLGLS